MKKINSHFQRFHIETIMYLIILIIALILLYLVMNNKLNIFQHFSGCPIPDLPLPNIEDNIYKFNKPLGKKLGLLFIHSPNCPYSINFKENVWNHYFIEPKSGRTYPTNNIIDRHGHDESEKNSDFGYDNMKYVLNSTSKPENYRIHSFFNDKFSDISMFNLKDYDNNSGWDGIDEHKHLIKFIKDNDGGDNIDSTINIIRTKIGTIINKNKDLLKTPVILLFDVEFFTDTNNTLRDNNYDKLPDNAYILNKDSDETFITKSDFKKDQLSTTSVYNDEDSIIILNIDSNNFESQIGKYLDDRFGIFTSGDNGLISCNKPIDKINKLNNADYGTDLNETPYIFIFAEKECVAKYDKENNNHPIEYLEDFIRQEISAKNSYLDSKLKDWNYGVKSNTILLLKEYFKKSVSLNITSCPTLIVQYGNHYQFINNDKLIDGWRDKLTIVNEKIDDNTTRLESSDELKEILFDFSNYYEQNKPTEQVQTTSVAEEEEEEKTQTTSVAEEEEEEKTQTTSTAEEEEEKTQTTSTG